MIWLALTILAADGFTQLLGFEAMSLRVFTHVTAPPGSDGGLLNAIVGSIIMTVIGVGIGAQAFRLPA